MKNFVHLHTHTHYSMLESTIKPKDLVARVKELEMPAVAVTDIGNMHGAVDFYFAAKDAGVKPILGSEVLYITGSRHDKSKPTKKIQYDQSNLDARLYHLVLLVKDARGYKNLAEILSKASMEGFLERGRADYELLEKHSEGLIALTGGLKGEIGYHVAHNRPDHAMDVVKRLRDIYKDDFFLELQENGLPEQSALNRFVLDTAKELSIPLVAANETFYMRQEQAFAQEVLMCIGAGRTLDENRAVRLVPDEYYLKDADLMTQTFESMPEAVSNTMLIADRCGFTFKLKDDKGKQIYHLPDYRPEGVKADAPFDTNEEIRKQSREGLVERLKEPQFAALVKLPEWKEKKKEYEKRLEEELEMIIKTGFPGYFLVVSDFIKWAKAEGIPVGPGRGSGAGSLVAYALKITDIDPIPFNLLFERFINPERVSMPDFDVDFCQDRRQEVINYVIRKYGTEKVAQIATFGKLSAKAVVKDVSRVMGIDFTEANIVSKLIPDAPGQHISLKDAFEKEPKLQEFENKEPRWARTFEVARELEGLYRQAGMHAAGVVITNKPLTDYCPLFAGKEGIAVVQYDKDYAEKVGLVKFDFLGLKTLTVIDNAVKFARESDAKAGKKEIFNLETINYADHEVYALIASGDTDGIFQLESSGMKDLCQRVVPSNLEDITAINALYRPGPLNSGMVDDYINRKHGRTEVTYELPQLKDILEETYGVIVYQEQVMRVARVLASYSLGEADILRRAMGKKKKEEMDQQREKFVAGATKNQIADEVSNRIFDLLAKFAEYGFNKSHSAAYGVLSYQTAFMKKYYPAEFMAAMLATEKDSTDKLTQYIADSRAHEIDVLPPDVNESRKTFSVVAGEKPSRADSASAKTEKAIRFGLEAIKGVGEIAVDAIVLEREEKGKFKDFVDFCERVPLRKVNKKVIEALIASGGFDSLMGNDGLNRATLFESMEGVMDHAAKTQEQADLGQVSFFDQYKSDSFKLDSGTSNLYKRMPDWSDSKKLQMEKQLVGFYVSGHPIEKWLPLVRDYITTDLAGVVEEYPAKKEAAANAPKPVTKGSVGAGGWKRDEGPKWDVVLACVVTSYREIVTRKGTKMAFAELEDMRGKIEAVCFPEAYEKFGPLLKQSIDECQPFLFTGNVPLEEENAKLFIRTIDPIDKARERKVNSVVFRLDPNQVNAERLAQLRAAIVRHRGKTATFLEYTGQVGESKVNSRHALPSELFVNPSAELVREVNTLFGREVVKFV